MKVPVRPRNSTPGDLSRENEDANSKRYLHPHVHCSVTDDGQGRAAAGGCPRKEKGTLLSATTAGSQGHHGKWQMPRDFTRVETAHTRETTLVGSENRRTVAGGGGAQ